MRRKQSKELYGIMNRADYICVKTAAADSLYYSAGLRRTDAINKHLIIAEHLAYNLEAWYDILLVFPEDISGNFTGSSTDVRVLCVSIRSFSQADMQIVLSLLANRSCFKVDAFTSAVREFES